MLIGVIALYLTGGSELINAVWYEEEPGKYGWLLYVAVFLGAIPGAAIGAAYFIKVTSKPIKKEPKKQA